MDPQVKAISDQRTCKFNPVVCKGFAAQQMKLVLPYMARLIKSIEHSFPDGMKFEGYQIATPIEQYRETTRVRQNQRNVDISRHDYYMSKFFFSYEGNELGPYYMNVIFSREGGLFIHRDTIYGLTPSLNDIGFSKTTSGVFINFNKTKCNFLKGNYNVLCDGDHVNTSYYYANIHQLLKDRKKSSFDQGRPVLYTTLSHYLFCKLGLTETMRKFVGVPVVVARNDDSLLRRYPLTQYMYFRSSQFYEGGPKETNISIIVPRAEVTRQNERIVRTMIGSFFYVFDAYPEEFKEISDVDEPAQWQYLLGRIIKGDKEARGAVVAAMDEHMVSTDTMLDELIQSEMKEIGIIVDDVYGLFYELMTTLHDQFLHTGTTEASMYNKRLTILHSIVEDFNSAITSLYRELQRRRNERMDLQAVDKLLKDFFKLNVCVNDISRHGEVVAVSSPGDNMIFRVTSNLIDSTSSGRPSGGRSKKKGSIIDDPAHVLHASIAEVGSFTNLPKSQPDGRTRINPTVQISGNGIVKPKEHLKALIARTEALISRRGSSGM